MMPCFERAMGWDHEAGDEKRWQFRQELHDAQDQHIDRSQAEDVFEKVVLKATTSVLSRRENLARQRRVHPARGPTHR